MKKLLIASAVAMLASLSGVASAATATATFNVSLTIQSSCTVTATDINLGSVAASTTTNVASSGANSISVTCTKGTPYNIGLQSTAVGAATNGTGTMTATNSNGVTGNTDSIAYALYRDAAFANAWGNVTGAGGNTRTGTVSTNGTSATGYGVFVRVLGNNITNKTADTYRDTIRVTVNY